MPTPEWPSCHLEIYEEPGFLDDCFRSSTWTKIQTASSESFLNINDIAGDYAVMSVTEGGTVNGCGWRRDIDVLNLQTDSYPLIWARLRGRGTTPQYKIEVEYTDTSTTTSGWIEAPESFELKMIQLSPGKTVRYVKLYARSNTPNQTAEVDYDYAAILKNPPIISAEVTELEADLVCNVAVSGLTIKMLNDPLNGSIERRYSFETNLGSKAYDLSPCRHQSNITGATWNAGKYGKCLYFLGASSSRVDTGYTTTIAGDESRTFAFWVKASPGASGVILGFGKTVVDWNRVQFNFSSDKIRLYVKDNTGNILQYTTTATVADNFWHHVVGIVSPEYDLLQVYVDGIFDGQAPGALDSITIDTIDLTIGCLHSSGGYTNHTTAYIDESYVFNRALTPKEIYRLATYMPMSGASRAQPGNIVMVYLASSSETQVSKLITARIIDRSTGGEPNAPWLELICEDLGEIIHECSFTHEYTSATQISAIVDDIVDEAIPGLYLEKDTTNRAIKNRFQNEGAWNLLEKLAESATFPTGENGANFYVDPGGSLRFKRYGAFTCSHSLTDGSDGETPNILDISVKGSIKGQTRLSNDIRIIVYEAEFIPVDEDGYTESADAWGSPDPTDASYPQSDTGDFVRGMASIHFNTTNPGQQYRMRLEFGDIDITGMDQVAFRLKHGAGLQPIGFDLKIQKSGWLWTADYRTKTGITPGSSGSWNTYTVNIESMTKTGNPGNIINHLEIRAYTTQPDLGTGGFLVDHLRFIRSEKAGTAQDSASQARYSKRTLRLVDKTITDLDYAGYLASNILEHRKNPLTTIQATVPGRGQPGYRPPMIIQVFSTKDGLNNAGFQIQRAMHHFTPSKGYTCHLELLAAKTTTGAYEAKTAPSPGDLGLELGAWRRRQQEALLNNIQTRWI